MCAWPPSMDRKFSVFLHRNSQTPQCDKSEISFLTAAQPHTCTFHPHRTQAQCTSGCYCCCCCCCICSHHSLGSFPETWENVSHGGGITRHTWGLFPMAKRGLNSLLSHYSTVCVCVCGQGGLLGSHSQTNQKSCISSHYPKHSRSSASGPNLES